MYDLGCMWIIYRDPLWYQTDYRVYMGSSMTVRPLAGRHCTCAIINWSVLRQLRENIWDHYWQPDYFGSLSLILTFVVPFIVQMWCLDNNLFMFKASPMNYCRSYQVLIATTDLRILPLSRWFLKHRALCWDCLTSFSSLSTPRLVKWIFGWLERDKQSNLKNLYKTQHMRTRQKQMRTSVE